MGALWEPEKENERGIGAMNTALCTWLFVLFCFFTLSPLFSSSFSSLSLIFCPCTVFFFCFRYMLPFVFFFHFSFSRCFSVHPCMTISSLVKKKKEGKAVSERACGSEQNANKQTRNNNNNRRHLWAKQRPSMMQASCYLFFYYYCNEQLLRMLWALLISLLVEQKTVYCLSVFFFFAGWNPCVHRKAEEKKKQLFITQCKNTRTQANRL